MTNNRRTRVYSHARDMRAPAPTDWDNLPLVLSLPQVQQVLGIGRDGVYALAHRQDFPALRVGRRMIVSRDALRAWLERQGER